MNKLLLLIFFLLILYSGCQSKREDAKKTTSDVSEVKDSQVSGDEEKKGEASVDCPVCGLSFSKSEAAKKHKYHSETYYFLLEDHFEAFKQNPSSFLTEKSDGPVQPK